MGIDSIWPLAVLACTSIAGVVGFGLKLRDLKKARLENEKLELEIATLRKAAAAEKSPIVIATVEQSLRIATTGSILASVRSRTHDNDISAYSSARPTAVSLRDRLIGILAIAGAVIFVSYAAYDLYRLARLLWSLL